MWLLDVETVKESKDLTYDISTILKYFDDEKQKLAEEKEPFPKGWYEITITGKETKSSQDLYKLWKLPHPSPHRIQENGMLAGKMLPVWMVEEGMLGIH